MKPWWILNDLFVAPAARRRGVAQALMARDNRPAQRLYESLGWGRDREFYTYSLDV